MLNPDKRQPGVRYPEDVPVGGLAIGVNVHKIWKNDSPYRRSGVPAETHYRGMRIGTKDADYEVTVYRRLADATRLRFAVISPAERAGTEVVLPPEHTGLVGPATKQELTRAGLKVDLRRDPQTGDVISAAVVQGEVFTWTGEKALS